MADLIVAGAGMAGLAAAARARELGASVTVYEKGDRPGGSMLLSSGVIWRYRELERFREECPGGDVELQRQVHERLDDALDWLESLGAPVTGRETGNPLTTGRRFHTAGLTEALSRHGGELRLGEPLVELPSGAPLVLATGGFQGDRELVREHVTPEAEHLLLRANRWSSGDGLRLGLAAGAVARQRHGRVLRTQHAGPARARGRGGLRAAGAALRPLRHGGERARRALRDAHLVGDRRGAVDRAAASARARYIVRNEALGERVRERTVGEMIEQARAAGAVVGRRDGATVLEVAAAITTTLGGLEIDGSARAAEGVFAAGADAGGVSTGGYSSGLAAALVQGRIAAEAALGH